MPSPTFPTLSDNVTGAGLSAGITTDKVKAAGFLWGAAMRTYDVFTGINFESDSQYYIDGERTIYKASFRYAGLKSILNSFTHGSNGTLRVYITTDDGGTQPRKVFESATAAPANPLDISTDTSANALTYTVGTEYDVTVTIITTGGTTAKCRIDYMAIQTANAYSFPALPNLADAQTPTAANLALVSQGFNYINDIAKAPTGQFATVSFTGQGVNTVFANGGFYARAKSATADHLQTDVTVISRWQSGTVTLKTYAAGSTTVIDSFPLTVNAAENTQPLPLTAASYSRNTFYRWSIESDTTNNRPDLNYVRYIAIGGAKAMTNNLSFPVQGGEVLGNNFWDKLGGTASTSNVNEIREGARGTGTNNGLQFLTPQHIGTIAMAPVSYSIGAPTIGPNGETLAGDGIRFTRPHVWRYLRWLPSAANINATLSYGANKSANLASSVATWQTFDLDSLTDLAQGMLYTISGSVLAAFEAQT
jgi:hypothetical protein